MHCLRMSCLESVYCTAFRCILFYFTCFCLSENTRQSWSRDPYAVNRRKPEYAECFLFAKCNRWNEEYFFCLPSTTLRQPRNILNAHFVPSVYGGHLATRSIPVVPSIAQSRPLDLLFELSTFIRLTVKSLRERFGIFISETFCNPIGDKTSTVSWGGISM